MLTKLAQILFLLAALSRAEVVYVNILHTNDIHGGIAPVEASFMNPDFPPGIGGGAWIAAYVNQVRESCLEKGEYCLLLDCGDIWQGTPVGNYNSGDFMIEWMNSMSYDMMTLGNHDFDRGAENAVRLAGLADFPVICSNFVTSNGDIPSPVQPWIIREFDGIKIAFMGVTTSDTYGLVDPELLEGYVIESELEAVESAMEEVHAEGADIVVLLSHLGQPPDPDRYTARVYEAWENEEEYTKDFAYNSAELTCLVKGIDLIVSGHTHVGLSEPWVNPLSHTIVVQGYANGTGIGHIRLALDTETGTIIGYDLPDGGEYISLLHDRFWPDTLQYEYINGFREIAEEGLDEVIGEAVSEIPRGGAEHPLGRLLSDAICEATGADVGLLNRGGIRAAIPRGPITPRTIYTAIPFEEQLYTIEVTGAGLLEILETGMQGNRRDMEISGFTCLRNQNLPDGSKIENPMVNGEPLDVERVYTLATTGYLAQGNVGYEILLEYTASPTGISFFQAAVDYVAAVSPLEPDNITRIIWIEQGR
jgi:5'-nucleotidase/UDP-sugar diphosphatase